MKKRYFLLTSVLVLSFILAACATPAATIATQSPTEAAAAQAQGLTAEISLVNYSFSPQELTIKKGTKVTWTNEDSVVHTVTSDTDVFASGNLSKGDKFSFTFDTVGTFPYHCIPHKAKMTGTITVTD